MRNPASLINKLTQDIERSIINAGDEGVTHEALMQAFKVGRTCVRNHLNLLEDEGRVYRVKRTKTRNRWCPPTTFHTFHAGSGKTPLDVHPVRRDYLVEAFFGPARQVNLLDKEH